jgi:hypothetical protein
VGRRQLSTLGGRLDRRDDFTSEELFEHGHRQEEIWSAPNPPVAVDREPTAGHDAVQVWVQGQFLALGVEHGQDAAPERVISRRRCPRRVVGS